MGPPAGPLAGTPQNVERRDPWLAPLIDIITLPSVLVSPIVLLGLRELTLEGERGARTAY